MDLKALRKKLKMTQIDVAKAVGVSVASYRLWEQGGGKPNPGNLEKLKLVLGVK